MNDIIRKTIDAKDKNTFLYLLHEEDIFDVALFLEYIEAVSLVTIENTAYSARRAEPFRRNGAAFHSERRETPHNPLARVSHIFTIKLQPISFVNHSI